MGGEDLISKILTILGADIKYTDIFELYIENCDTVLDLGCGSDSPIQNLKVRKEYTVGVDIFFDYVNKSKKKKIHDKYFIFDIVKIDKLYDQKAFDCVILMDAIEHLTKQDGLEIIKKMVKIAKKKIIIFTPNGFLRQDEYHNNVYQIHRSGWNVKELRRMGFKIYGIRGLKWLRGDLAKINHRPINLWRFISKISNRFVKYFPQFAFQLLCIKEVSKK